MGTAHFVLFHLLKITSCSCAMLSSNSICRSLYRYYLSFRSYAAISRTSYSILDISTDRSLSNILITSYMTYTILAICSGCS